MCVAVCCETSQVRLAVQAHRMIQTVLVRVGLLADIVKREGHVPVLAGLA